MNQQIIRSIVETRELARRVLPKLPEERKEQILSRRRRSAPLSFIGELPSTPFGTATLSDLQQVADKVNRIIANGNTVSETLVQHERNFQTFMKGSNARFGKLREVATANHDALLSVKNDAFLALNRSMMGIRANTNAVARLNSTLTFMNHMKEIQAGIMDLSRGFFSAVLISDPMIRRSARRITKLFTHLGLHYELLHEDPQYFYQHGSFNVHVDRNTSIWLTLKFPVAPKGRQGHYFKVDVYPVPAVNGSKHATKISGLPQYAVLTSDPTHIRYAALSSEQLAQCRGTTAKVCSFSLPFWDLMTHDSCLASLLR
ncbi:MAG: hypothetical protein AB2531_12275, partial [Candidatus Thiodiazotropha sp.]